MVSHRALFRFFADFNEVFLYFLKKVKKVIAFFEKVCYTSLYRNIYAHLHLVCGILCSYIYQLKHGECFTY